MNITILGAANMACSIGTRLVAGGNSLTLLSRDPPAARVVKAFNTTFARTLVAGTVAGQPLDVFIAGDDAAAKATIPQLVEAGGLCAIDTGPLSRARHLEEMGLLGTHFMSVWKWPLP